MPKYPRLKNEHIQPVDQPVPRDQARAALISYLLQVGIDHEPYADMLANEFDYEADEHDNKLDDAYEAATSDASVEVEEAASEIDVLKDMLAHEADPKERKTLEKDMKRAEASLARYQAVIDKAEAKRTAGKSDYRKLLLKVARHLVSEEELMERGERM